MSGHTQENDQWYRRPGVFWGLIVSNVLFYGLGILGFYQYQHGLHDRARMQAATNAVAHATNPASVETNSRALSPAAEPPDGWAMIRNACYHALQLFILHTPHLEGDVPVTLDFARWLAPVAFGLTTIFTFGGNLCRHFRRLTLMWVRDHTVICGLGEKGLALVYCHRGHQAELADPTPGEPTRLQSDNSRARPRRREPVVVIEQDPNNPLIHAAEDAGAVVLIGSVTNRAILREARLTTAVRVVAVCGDDGTNIEVATRVQEFMRDQQRPAPLDCVVHLTSLNLLNALKSTRVTEAALPNCRLKHFDIYEFSAAELLKAWPPGVAPEGVAPPATSFVFFGFDLAGRLVGMELEAQAMPRGTRILILGFGRMGRAVAVKAAEEAEKMNIQLELHVFDRHADRKEERFKYRFQQATGSPQVHWHAGEVDAKQAVDKVYALCREAQFQSMIVLTTDSDILNTELALRFLEALKSVPVRIAVRLTSVHGLATLFSEESSAGLDLKRLRSFGKIRDMCCDRAYMGDSGGPWRTS